MGRIIVGGWSLRARICCELVMERNCQSSSGSSSGSENYGDKQLIYMLSAKEIWFVGR